MAKIAAAHSASMRVRVFEPSRLAFSIEFRTTKPAAFLLNGLQRALHLIEPGRRSEEAHVTVVDARGERVFESGGGGWVRKDLVSCAGYGWYGRHGTGEPAPPPCPLE